MDFDPSTMAWAMDEDDLGHLIEAISSSTAPVSFDTETTGLDEHATHGGPSNGGVAARVVMATFTVPADMDDLSGVTWVLPLSHPDSPWRGRWRTVLAEVMRAFVDNDVAMITQNGKFDCRWVYATTGIDISRRQWWDTRVSSHLIDETRSTSLKARASETFGIQRWDDHDLTYPGAAEDVPLFELGEYAARDTYWTWRLARLHLEQLYLVNVDGEEPMTAEEVEDARLGQLAVWCAMPTVTTLTAIEQRGLSLDVPWVREQLEEHRRLAAETFEELTTLYEEISPDHASLAPTATWFREWSEVAVRRGDLVVAALTPSGKPQWNKDVLKRQARTGSKVAETLLAHRDHAKKAEFLSSWLDQVAPDGRIYTTYNAGSVATGRLSSSGPNMQQVTKALRPAFIPSEGYYLADIDYSQIELRVAAFISRSEPMMEAFRQGRDLHTAFGARITGKPESEVGPLERQAAKSANFGLLYGMGAWGFREYAESQYDVHLTEEEAARIHREFFEMWEGLKGWHKRSAEKVHRDGQITSPIGRVRRLPEVFEDNHGHVLFAERAAINSPVQGFASDLMQIAASSIEGTLPGVNRVPKARLVGTVHDSILVEVPKDDWEEVTRQCIERMTEGVQPALNRMGCTLDVPLAAEASVATRWGIQDIGTIE